MNFSSIKDGLLGNVGRSPSNKHAAGASIVPGNSQVGETVASRKGNRLVGLDFAKGALVLTMVFYHWMNYFIGLDSPIYKYLRFLTPSFIFVTGFLISHVYLCRFDAGEKGIPARLVQRGFKLIGIVFVLNSVIRFLGSGTAARHVAEESLNKLFCAYLTGSAAVAFSVLVPIAYLLILSAGLVLVAGRSRKLVHVVSCAIVVAVGMGEWAGIQNGYLDLLSIGLLGMSAGQIPIEMIQRAVRHPMMIWMAYVIYLGAISVWNVVYILQILGVCVNILLLYWLGSYAFADNVLGRTIMRLGEYSLFAYISQIVILQILRRDIRFISSGLVGVSVAFAVGVICTVLSVEIIDRLKRNIVAVKRLYITVFS